MDLDRRIRIYGNTITGNHRRFLLASLRHGIRIRSYGVGTMAKGSAFQLNRAGFSLQEVLVVVAIGLIITAAALATMSNAIANMKLRASMTSVSGLLQN